MTHTIAVKSHSGWMNGRVHAAETEHGCIETFLRHVERRALRMAELATGNRDDAMELVQEAMFGFVRHYAAKPSPQWPPLFYRVLDSRLNDWHRRRQVRQRWAMFPALRDDADAGEEIAQAPDLDSPGPLQKLEGTQAASALDRALAGLPLRQRQVFLLRIWEGFDVATTAGAMRCSQGTVKTHLSRALAALRRELDEFA